jgi:hypothetical protein
VNSTGVESLRTVETLCSRPSRRHTAKLERQYGTVRIQVSQGIVTRSSVRLMLRRTKRSLIAAVDSTAVGPQLGWAVRRLRSGAIGRERTG